MDKTYGLQEIISGLDDSELPTTIFLDTGAGAYLVDENWLPDTWTFTAITTFLPRLRAAGNEPIAVSTFIPLQIKLDDLNVRVRFGIDTELAVNVLMGT